MSMTTAPDATTRAGLTELLDITRIHAWAAGFAAAKQAFNDEWAAEGNPPRRAPWVGFSHATSNNPVVWYLDAMAATTGARFDVSVHSVAAIAVPRDDLSFAGVLAEVDTPRPVADLLRRLDRHYPAKTPVPADAFLVMCQDLMDER